MTDFDADKVAEIHQQLHSHLPSESALRVKALETLLVDKGLVESATIDAWIEALSASMFVCSAMSLISSMMLPISCELSPRRLIRFEVS